MNAVVVDTGVFSAPFSRRRNAIASLYDRHLRSNLLVLASQTVAELRYGALVAGWGPSRLAELERRIGLARVAAIDDDLIWTHARLRLACRQSGHALSSAAHAADLWVAATATHFAIPLVTHDAVFRDAPGLTVITEL